LGKINFQSSSQYLKELKLKASRFIRFIAGKGLYGKITLIKDYKAKVEIIRGCESYGYLIIHYKPTKMRYSISTNEIRKPKMTNLLESYWELMCDEEISRIGKYVIEINLSKPPKRKKPISWT